MRIRFRLSGVQRLSVMAKASENSNFEVIDVDAPYFEDLSVGQEFRAPGLTITSGHALLHQALFGDRQLLPLDHHLCEKVTGKTTPLAHSCLVANIAIGQSTEATQRVKGNLFYSNFIQNQPVWIGDTLRTTSKVVAMRANRAARDRDATGMVVLEVSVVNQEGVAVMRFYRCPMLASQNAERAAQFDDSFDQYLNELRDDEIISACATDWDLSGVREACEIHSFANLKEGQKFMIKARDSVSCAPELVRATLNVARVHTDASASHLGERLVYGGHTISMACGQISRAIPGIVAIPAWHSCVHTAPVLEGYMLRTEVSVVRKIPLSDGSGICTLRALTFASADSGDSDQDKQVLDWIFSAHIS